MNQIFKTWACLKSNYNTIFNALTSIDSWQIHIAEYFLWDLTRYIMDSFFVQGPNSKIFHLL